MIFFYNNQPKSKSSNIETNSSIFDNYQGVRCFALNLVPRKSVTNPAILPNKQNIFLLKDIKYITEYYGVFKK
ncbi:hypothetical protein DT74_04990 [Acinetobacter sp. ETR1]|nr:hypothetical protein DT74_04990 [Acinetobacter sp. ETR1]